MAEVIIELKLNRRSGVLAAAIAALRHLPLSIVSQQILDLEGGPRLLLTTEGQIDSLTDVEQTYASTRGVSRVVDVRVNGLSLSQTQRVSGRSNPELDLEHVPASNGQLENVIEPSADPAASAPDPTPQRTARDDSDRPAAADAEDDGFSDEAFARHVLVESRAIASIDGQSSSNASPADESHPDGVDNRSRGGLKSSMFRRRRRLR